MRRCLWTAATVAIGVLIIAVSLALLSADARVLRPPVFMAVIALAGGAGACAGGWRGVQAAADDEKWGVLACAAAIASCAWTIGYLHTASDDYRLYELAARRWVAGENLYLAQGHNQLPTALVLVGATRLGIGALVPYVDDAQLWQLTYYAHEFQQLLWSIVIVAAIYALAERAGAARPRAASIAGLGVLLALPVRESLGNNQLNVPVLALAVTALASAARRPLLAGCLIGIGGMLKLYPLALLPAALIAGRWRVLAAAASVVALFVVVFWSHWIDFAGFVGQSAMSDSYRHVGLHAIVVNTTRALVRAAGGESWRGLATAAWLATIVAVGTWVLWVTVDELKKSPEERRTIEAAARALAAVLLVFPLAWAHHFIFAIPLAVCIWARGWPRPRHIAATALLFLVPAFDIYPLGVHRLAGLVLLLVR